MTTLLESLKKDKSIKSGNLIRSLMPEIRKAINNGFSLTDIHEKLVEQKRFDKSYATFRRAFNAQPKPKQ